MVNKTHIRKNGKKNTKKLTNGKSLFNTLATGYGDFRTSVAKRRRRAMEISVFPYGWMEEGFGFVMC